MTDDGQREPDIRVGVCADAICSHATIIFSVAQAVPARFGGQISTVNCQTQEPERRVMTTSEDDNQPQKAWVEEYGPGLVEPEHQAVERVLQRRGVTVKHYTRKQLMRRQVPALDNAILIAGDHDSMKVALKQLFRLGSGGGSISESERVRPVPTTDSYPEALRPFMKRRIWTTRVGSLVRDVSCELLTLPIFVKPAGDTKRFTGFVLKSFHDLYNIQHLPPCLAVYVSEVVEWESEWRVFVLHSKVVGIRCYRAEGQDFAYTTNDPQNAHALTGYNGPRPDRAIVQAAVEALEASSSPQATAGYSLDFGVLTTPGNTQSRTQTRTTLVEWNDGFALGAYGLDDALYTDLLLARWSDLQKQAGVQSGELNSITA